VGQGTRWDAGIWTLKMSSVAVLFAADVHPLASALQSFASNYPSMQAHAFKHSDHHSTIQSAKHSAFNHAGIRLMPAISIPTFNQRLLTPCSISILLVYNPTMVNYAKKMLLV
jgi:hypothetical protein